MIGLRPYLTFSGNCREAMEFYAECLGGELTSVMTFAGSPMADGLPQGDKDRIMHCELKLPCGVIFASDTMPGKQVEVGVSMSVSMSFDSAEEARSGFDQLAEGGGVVMPFDLTFWGEHFGMVRDRYGFQWMFSAPGK